MKTERHLDQLITPLGRGPAEKTNPRGQGPAGRREGKRKKKPGQGPAKTTEDVLVRSAASLRCPLSCVRLRTMRCGAGSPCEPPEEDAPRRRVAQAVSRRRSAKSRSHKRRIFGTRPSHKRRIFADSRSHERRIFGMSGSRGALGQSFADHPRRKCAYNLLATGPLPSPLRPGPRRAASPSQFPLRRRRQAMGWCRKARRFPKG
jgi:hypothetical protein